MYIHEYMYIHLGGGYFVLIDINNNIWRWKCTNYIVGMRCNGPATVITLVFVLVVIESSVNSTMGVGATYIWGILVIAINYHVML